MSLSRSRWLLLESQSTRVSFSFLHSTRIAQSLIQLKTVSSPWFLDEMSNEGKWFFFCLIIFSNLAFLLSWTWNFSSEIKGRCRLKFPKLYVCLCLCCRKSLLAEEVSQEKASKYRETIISEVDNLRASESSLMIRVADCKEQAHQRRGVWGWWEIQEVRSNGKSPDQ